MTESEDQKSGSESYKSYTSFALPVVYRNALQNRFEKKPTKVGAQSYVDKLLIANGYSRHEEASENAQLTNIRRIEQQRVEDLKNYYFNKLSLYHSNENASQYADVPKVWEPVVSTDAFKDLLEAVDINGPAGSSLNGNGISITNSVTLDPLLNSDFKPPSIPPPEPPQISDSSLDNSSNESTRPPSPAFGTAAHKRFTDLAKNEEFKNSFLNYTHCPILFGRHRLPPMVYHASAALDEKVYIFGGLRLVQSDDPADKDISRIKVKGPSFPFPLKTDILNHPALVSNSELFVLDHETSILQSPLVTGDIPPPLCCASATVLTDRYIFYYGGFEIRSMFNSTDSKEFRLDRDLVVNSNAWVFDATTFRFKKLDLIPDPDAPLKVPIKLERFAHTVVAPLFSIDSGFNRNGQKGQQTQAPDMLASSASVISDDPAASDEARKSSVSLYVFGGYSYNPTTHKFSCSNYNWKIKLAFTHDGVSNLLRFRREALYGCLESQTEGPSPRGFHAATLLDETVKLERLAVNNHSTDQHRWVSHFSPAEFVGGKEYNADAASGDNNGFSNSSLHTTTGPDTEKPNKANRKQTIMLVHGGTNLTGLFGDLWKYTFATKTWEKLATKSNKYNHDCSPTGELFAAEAHRANHQIIMLDKYLLFAGGFDDSFMLDELLSAKRKFNQPANYKDSWLPDVYDVAKQLVKNQEGTFLRSVMLDLNTNTWIYAKLSHKIMNYVDYKEIFFPEVPGSLPVIKDLIETGNEQELRRLIAPYNLSESLVRKLIFLLRTKGLLVNHVNVLGGSICFSNGKLCLVGGLYLWRASTSIVNYTKTDLAKGFPFGVVIMLEMPIFAQGSVNLHKNELKFLLA